MIGDSYTAVWWVLVPENNMAAFLMVMKVTNFSQCFGKIPA